MRKVWLLASAVLAFLNFVKSQELARTLYSPRYDNLDIDTILASNRLVSNYVDCLLSRKPCPPEGKDLKRILPEALRTKCARCSPTQKENALKIITRLYYDYPDQYRALRERWDPSGEYHRRFEEYLRGLQFNQIGGSGGGGGTGGGTGAVAGGNGGGGNTVQTGGNDRPVRNDLDRQPATQSSNVQSVVIDPAQQLGQQASGTVNTPTAAIPSSFPPAVAPATERPRPPAPAPPAPPVLVNRFGEDADPVRPTIAAPAPVTTTTTRRPTTTVRQTRPVTRQTSTTRNTQRTTTRFAANAPLPAASPIVGLWNQLGTKIADTADAIAGMLKKTVDVLVTSHIQSHQRALRGI
ncbi:translation initiation factor IF-2-like isoform X3 [Anopheles aquasalis]|uniref:translation initiation factor IF-2-like isoform X3 n=1 Tax=Anopheles aquasalis TaxID=42839 RepID=UPI00215ADF00|nr:translation initiation factor IF-2-like isoform X3 [Anopheles aquasalis]